MASKLSNEARLTTSEGPAPKEKRGPEGESISCNMASKLTSRELATFGGKLEPRDAGKSNLGLPQREKMRPTIWPALAPLAPAKTTERTETAQGPSVQEQRCAAWVRGKGPVDR